MSIPPGPVSDRLSDEGMPSISACAALPGPSRYAGLEALVDPGGLGCWLLACCLAIASSPEPRYAAAPFDEARHMPVIWRLRPFASDGRPSPLHRTRAPIP